MKHFLSCCILLTVCFYANAQTDTFPRKAGRVYYEIVDSSFRGMTKGQLYGMSKLWLFDQFQNVNDYLQLDIPEEGLIAGKITLPEALSGAFMSPYDCVFSFVVISKDGKYKAQLYDFRLNNPGNNISYPIEQFLDNPENYKDYKKTFPKLEIKAYGFIRSIEHAMQSVYDVMDF